MLVSVERREGIQVAHDHQAPPGLLAIVRKDCARLGRIRWGGVVMLVTLRVAGGMGGGFASSRASWARANALLGER